MASGQVESVYEVRTKRLNEQYRRNLVRFPHDFAFQLTGHEWATLKQASTSRADPNLKSQIATSSPGHGLLTRARQGMVIFVPPGNLADPTRAPTFYDSTFGHLTDLGIPAIN